MTSAAELRELDDDELEARLVEYRRELLNLRFQLATGQLDNSARLGQARKDLARVLTLLREREIAFAEGRVIEPLPHVERPPRPPRTRKVQEETYEEEEPYEQDEGEPAEVAVAEDVMEDEVLAEEPELEEPQPEGAESEPVELEEAPAAPKRAGRLRPRRRSRAKATGAEAGEADDDTDEEEQ
jgi:large subunit ribosomal protein L29